MVFMAIFEPETCAMGDKNANRHERQNLCLIRNGSFDRKLQLLILTHSMRKVGVGFERKVMVITATPSK